MKVKNVSTRLHHIGNVSIAPGEEKEIQKQFENSINKAELVPVVPVKASAPPAPGSPAAKKAAAIAGAEKALATAQEAGDPAAITAAEEALAKAKA